MGTYYVPRNYKGESRILYIFTTKSLITTGVGALIGSVFFIIFGMILNYKMVGFIIMGIFGLLGWICAKNTYHSWNCSYKKSRWRIIR